MAPRSASRTIEESPAPLAIRSELIAVERFWSMRAHCGHDVRGRSVPAIDAKSVQQPDGPVIGPVRLWEKLCGLQLQNNGSSTAVQRSMPRSWCLSKGLEMGFDGYRKVS